MLPAQLSYCPRRSHLYHVQQALLKPLQQLLQEKKILQRKKMNKVEKSKLVGAAVARKAGELGIKDVVFDRGGYLYHGRVKAVAEGAREGGVQF